MVTVSEVEDASQGVAERKSVADNSNSGAASPAAAASATGDKPAKKQKIVKKKIVVTKKKPAVREGPRKREVLKAYAGVAWEYGKTAFYYGWIPAVVLYGAYKARLTPRDAVKVFTPFL